MSAFVSFIARSTSKERLVLNSQYKINDDIYLNNCVKISKFFSPVYLVASFLCRCQFTIFLDLSLLVPASFRKSMK